MRGVIPHLWFDAEAVESAGSAARPSPARGSQLREAATPSGDVDPVAFEWATGPRRLGQAKDRFGLSWQTSPADLDPTGRLTVFRNVTCPAVSRSVAECPGLAPAYAAREPEEGLMEGDADGGVHRPEQRRHKEVDGDNRHVVDGHYRGPDDRSGCERDATSGR